jgi:hypothetical protein
VNSEKTPQALSDKALMAILTRVAKGSEVRDYRAQNLAGFWVEPGFAFKPDRLKSRICAVSGHFLPVSYQKFPKRRIAAGSL